MPPAKLWKLQMDENEIMFRRAEAADLPAIVAMLADDSLGKSREDPGWPLASEYEAAFDAISSDHNQLLVVAIMRGDIVATIQLSFIPGMTRRGAWRGQIEGVRVVKSARSLRIGTRMLEWAIAQCRARGCRIVQLTTDKSRTDAHRLYRRLGFEASHDGYKLAL